MAGGFPRTDKSILLDHRIFIGIWKKSKKVLLLCTLLFYKDYVDFFAKVVTVANIPYDTLVSSYVRGIIILSGFVPHYGV